MRDFILENKSSPVNYYKIIDISFDIFYLKQKKGVYELFSLSFFKI